MTRIVISAPLVGEQRTGPGVHLTELVRAMLAARTDLEVRTRQASIRGRAAHRASAARIDARVRAATIPVPTTALRPLQAATHFPSERLLLGGYDVYHQFHTDADPAVPDQKLVVTLHDTVALDWPDAEGRMYVHADRLLRRAAAVLTVSRFSKDAICAAFEIAPQRVHVAYNGVDHERFRPGESPRPFAVPYVLFVGGQTPRKNVPRMIEAFARARAELDRPDLRFVLAGPVRAAERQLRAGAPQSLPPEALAFVGHVPDDEVVALYRHADALLYASLYEGFGMPALEAMACGTPVIAGSGSALSEIAGPAAELPDPTDTAAIADAIGRVLREGPDRRAARRARGIDHAAAFTWDRCARTVLDVYDSVTRR
ncbi:glycosyltransferase family 4 protein [uncultured Jatrophihabitans sp.]|uniref:glycosyltransferase family 4 protein n=1 Tax=uncultured Jatrophihabitans sp. TaxID=1610747 RepID=UPI0035CB2E9C